MKNKKYQIYSIHIRAGMVIEEFWMLCAVKVMLLTIKQF